MKPSFKSAGVIMKDPVTPEQIDGYARLAQVSRDGEWHAVELRAWRDQSTQERSLRKTYALSIFILLSLQILALHVIVFMMGFNVLSIDPWVAKVFLVMAFTEVSTIFFWVVKYLFPASQSQQVPPPK